MFLACGQNRWFSPSSVQVTTSRSTDTVSANRNSQLAGSTPERPIALSKLSADLRLMVYELYFADDPDGHQILSKPYNQIAISTREVLDPYYRSCKILLSCQNVEDLCTQTSLWAVQSVRTLFILARYVITSCKGSIDFWPTRRGILIASRFLRSDYCNLSLPENPFSPEIPHVASYKSHLFHFYHSRNLKLRKGLSFDISRFA